MPAIQVPCPKCGSRNTRVVLTQRTLDEVLVRRRSCLACDYRWYTEQPQEVPVSSYRIQWSKNGKVLALKPLTSLSEPDAQHSGDG